MLNDKILVVDDNPLNLKLAKVILTIDKYDIRTASSAKEALEIMDQFHPRLILMDIQMPVMDGLELSQIIKSSPDYKDVIIIGLTAYATKEDEQRILEAGCDSYISKPFDTELLLKKIRAYLS